MTRIRNITKTSNHQITLFIATLLMILTSCNPPTIEEMVDELINYEIKDKEKENIAIKLADSLNTYALQLLIGHYKANKNTIDKILKYMINRYLIIAKYSNRINKDKSMECIRFIVSPFIDNGLSDITKINYIIYALCLEEKDDNFEFFLIDILKQYSTFGIEKTINAWSNNRQSKSLFNAIKSFDDQAIIFLANQLGSNEVATDLLARIGEPAVYILYEKMNSNDVFIRFAAADALIRMYGYNPGAVNHLTEAIEEQNIDVVANNYPFYIRLGLEGTEKLLVKALKKKFSLKTCLDFLNCGNTILEREAKLIAEKRGYKVLIMYGEHSGPKWGENNRKAEYE